MTTGNFSESAVFRSFFPPTVGIRAAELIFFWVDWFGHETLKNPSLICVLFPYVTLISFLENASKINQATQKCINVGGVFFASPGLHMKLHQNTSLSVATCGNMRLHAATCGYMRLHAATCSDLRLSGFLIENLNGNCTKRYHFLRVPGVTHGN